MKILPTKASFLVTERCNFSCRYCVPKGTKILMSDFTEKNIENIKINDEVLGFDEFYKEGNKSRKIKKTKVTQLHNKKETLIKIKLENGMILKTTKNHPILNNRGNSKFSWRQAGNYKKDQNIMTFPYIPNDKVNVNSINYIIGYVIGVILGDGTHGIYKDKQGYNAFRTRIAVKDIEIIDRMRKYFKILGFDNIREGQFLISKKYNIRTTYLYSNSQKTFYKLQNLIKENFIINQSYEYYCGFLSGIYDAEGSIDKKGLTIRICNSDLNIIKTIQKGLNLLKIKHIIEKNKNVINKQTYNIRILSPLNKLDNLKFIQIVQPAIKRKGLDNFYLKNYLTSYKIVEIIELNEKVDVYNIGTTTHTYFANNFAVHNCFEQNKKEKKNIMTEEIAKKGIDLLYDNAQKIKSDNVNVLLFGGEPLLNSKLIEVIFDYGLKKEKETGIKFTSDIITNGSIMNDYIYWLFMEYKDKVNLSCQLSVDGIKKVHDMYRVTKKGKGSFNLIEKNINKFKTIYRNHPEMLTVHGCINKKTLSYLFESYKFFREKWDMRNIWFMPVHEEEWTENDLIIYKKELDKIFNYILNKVKETNSIKEVHYFTPYNKCFIQANKPNAPCGVGKSLITITANGDIYPCHNFYFNDDNEETKIGDIWNGINEDKIKPYRDYSCDDMSCPKECDHYNCYRCVATNWVHKGDMLDQIQGIYCKMQKAEKEFTDKMKEELIKIGIYEKRNKYKNQSNQYYEKNYKNIMSKAMQLLILKVTDLEGEIKELKEVIQNKEVV